MSDDDTTRSRRSFFRQLFIRGAEKLEESGKKFGEQFAQFVEPEPTPYQDYNWGYDDWQDSGQRFLRPPGALAEPAFSDTCSRCGDCVKACPAQAIRIDTSENADHPEGDHRTAGGLPYIIARESPCVVCTDLSCMNACPTGALEKLQSRNQIQMGYATTDHSRCLRGMGYEVYDDPSTLEGEDCQVCVSQCPLEDEAIGIDDHGTVEIRHGCIGCGVCEQVCPAEPEAVWVGAW